MKTRFLRSTVLFYIALFLIACQPIQPLLTTSQPASALSTYTDKHDFFTADYPADWVALGYLFADAPFPHVGIGSHQEIIDLSTADQLLPEDQIGVGLMLIPRDMFAEAGLTADTPLAEVLPLLLMAMADDTEVMAGLIDDAVAEPHTLANGAPAVRLAFDGLTEGYGMALADLGDGLYLFASRIQALDHHNAALEAQVDAVVDSFVLTASAEQVMGFIMTQMGAMEVQNGAAPTVTFTATEYAYAGPESIPAGLTRIELVNAGEKEHMLWAVKLDEGKGFEDLMGVFAAFETEPAFPEWMAWYGGVTAGPGNSAAYTIDLTPGTYTLFSFSQDENGEPDAAKGMVATLTVTEGADTAAAPPVADLRMELVDFSFIIEGEPAAGPQIVEIANTGMEPHEVVLLNLAEGASIQDVMTFMMAGENAEGAPPFEFSGGAGPIEAGMTAWYEADLPSGEYGIICFLPSPANEGAPHFMLGMVQQVSVP
jgi:hypothetical protein